MKTRLRLLAAFSAMVLPLAAAWSESANPFISSGAPPSSVAAQRLPGPVAAVVAMMAPILQNLSDRLVTLTRSIRGATGPGPLLALLFVSLVYGVFHALGPGHGKTLVSTFFVARDAKLRHSLIAGYFIALVHAISALSMVMILYFIIHGIFSADFESTSRILRIVSFAIITVMGAVMLVRRILGIEHSHGHGSAHTHSHNHEHVHGMTDGPESQTRTAGDPPELRTRELWGVAVASGLVPCPGASAVILLSLSLNMVAVSILAVAMISVGMGFTITVIGAVAILVKRGVIRAARPGKSNKASWLRRALEIGGSAALFAFGLLFFLSQF
jgi:ABC-type nickel/cobalt efflux system permease component RcnA